MPLPAVPEAPSLLLLLLQVLIQSLANLRAGDGECCQNLTGLTKGFPPAVGHISPKPPGPYAQLTASLSTLASSVWGPVPGKSFAAHSQQKAQLCSQRNPTCLHT